MAQQRFFQTHTISFTNTPTQVLFTLSRGIGFRSQPTSKQRNIWWRWNTCTEVLVDFILLKYKLLDLWRLNKRFNVQIILFNIHPLNLPDIDVSDYRMCKCLWEKSLIMEIKVCLKWGLITPGGPTHNEVRSRDTVVQSCMIISWWEETDFGTLQKAK